MTNRYGMYHLSGVTDEHLKAYVSLHPAWVVLLDPEVKHIEAIRNVSPDTKIAARYYRSDGDYAHGISSNPAGYAKEIARELQKNPVYLAADLAITSNEVAMDWKEIGNLDQYYQALQDAWPHPLGLYSTPVESIRWDKEPYDESLMAYVAQLQTSMTQGLDHGDIFCAHQYNAPRLWRPGEMDKRPQDNLNYNRIVRYEQHIWPRLSHKLQKLPVLMSEFGYDFLTWPTHRHGGWLDPDGPPTVDDAYHDIADFTNKWDHKYHDVPVVGWVFYCVGDSGGWGQYQADKSKGGGETLLNMIAKHLPGGDWPKKRGVHAPAGEHKHQPKEHSVVVPAPPPPHTITADARRTVMKKLEAIEFEIGDIRKLLKG